MTKSLLIKILSEDKKFNLKKEMNIPYDFYHLTFTHEIRCNGKDVFMKNLDTKDITVTSMESLLGKFNLENR
jgi:hypothetical protein